MEEKEDLKDDPKEEKQEPVPEEPVVVHNIQPDDLTVSVTWDFK